MKMVKIYFLACLFSIPASAKEIHVSLSGSDSNEGSLLKPLKTIAAAKNKVRKLNKNMTEDLNVYIHEGIYHLNEPLVFDSQDSGTEGHSISYQAFGNDIVSIRSAIYLNKWKKTELGDEIYKSNPPKFNYRHLIINQSFATRARAPNKKSDGTFGPYFKAQVLNNTTIELEPEKLLTESSYQGDIKSDIELIKIDHWYHNRIKLSSIKKIDNKIIVKTPNEKPLHKPLDFYKNTIYYLENSIGFLDDNNEWFYDKKDSVTYLKESPKTIQKKNNIWHPTLENLITISGSPTNPVENIEFKNLTIEGTTWLAPQDKSINFTQLAQPLKGYEATVPATIALKHTKRIKIKNNTIRLSGGNAINLFDSDESEIEGNKIYNISANGIQVDSDIQTPDDSERSTDVLIWNNEIFNTGQEFTNGGAILVGNTKNTVIEHNLIYNLPYTGIQLCNQPGNKRHIGCENNRICYNHIHNAMRLHDDGGAIYTLGGHHKNTVIAENFIHDVKAGLWAGNYPVSAIYLDNFTSNVTVRDNVIVGGKAEERNGSKNNFLIGNDTNDETIKAKSGIARGYNPKLSSCSAAAH
ncbi:right-handed parallel beta-helix repeat-containing protein [Rheinheimera marina]|uniref:Right-handed parallel beta-helix repeat-containing protein n=1 Tax=Rheinheimera marina TaxID=1774958 RepID=A0ABV9JR93_9GAMM